MMIDEYRDKILDASACPPQRRGLLSSTVFVDMDEVAHWYWSVDDKDLWGWEDFPCVIPPWVSSWFEWNFPKTIRANGKVERTSGVGLYKCGSHVLRFGPRSVRTVDLKKVVPALLGTQFPFPEEGLVFDMSTLVVIRTFFKTLRGLESGFFTAMCLREDGSIIDRSILMGPSGPMFRSAYRRVDKDLIRDFMQNTTFPLMLALSLLHCNNVSVVDKKHPHKKGKKKSKNPEKKGKLQFKLLKIDTMKQVVSGGSGSNGECEKMKKALHTYRGHFKDYRKGKGLFGRLKGLYWWSEGERGDKSEGEIQKTIKVDA